MPTLQSVSHDTASGRAGPVPRPGPVLSLACAGPLVIGYVGTAAVLGLVAATAAGAAVSTTGVLGAAGSAWLALYHVPITIGGHELGMLPLLPTILVLAMVARAAGNAARRLGWDTPRSALGVAAAFGVSHAVFATLIALIRGGASPVVAFFVVGLLAAVAALVGTARRCGLVPAALSRADESTEIGVHAGVLAVVTLCAVGTVVFGVALLASWSKIAALFQVAAPGFGSGLGMFLLCLAYLPNVLVGALSFTAGPGFVIGRVVVAQWHFHGGAIPAVPLLGPLPSVAAHWWVFLMLLPIAAGVLVGRVCRFPVRRVDRLRAIGVAAVVAGVSWLVLSALAGGVLAGGLFSPVVVPAGALALAVALYVAIPGAVTVLLAGREMFVADIDYDESTPQEDDTPDENEPDEAPADEADIPDDHLPADETWDDHIPGD